jgi:hypothetical protein
VVEWDAIDESFSRLRDFVLNDLDQIAAQEQGGNFAVVALVLAACDALGFGLYGRGNGYRVFGLCLPPDWRPVARTLYDALRNGLIHRYEARVIATPGDDTAFQIAWTGSRHLTFTDNSRSVLCVVARDLVAGLHDAFAEVEEQLRTDPAAREAFYRNDGKGREHDIRLNTSQLRAWQQIRSAASVVPAPVNPAGATGPPDSFITATSRST